jgi:hypothetical protein
MAFQKGLGCLGRKCCYEAAVGMRQIYDQVVRLLLHTGDHSQSFAKIHLLLPRWMHQRHEHLQARTSSPRT